MAHGEESGDAHERLMAAVYNSQAGGADWRVLMAIAKEARLERGEWQAAVSIKHIALRTGLSSPTILAGIRRLEERGELRIIARGGGKGNPNVYAVTVLDPVPQRGRRWKTSAEPPLSRAS